MVDFLTRGQTGPSRGGPFSVLRNVFDVAWCAGSGKPARAFWAGGKPGPRTGAIGHRNWEDFVVERLFRPVLRPR